MTRPYEVMIIIDADLEEETIRAAVERWLQLIESQGADVLATFAGGDLDGRPAVTRHSFGKGHASYLGTRLDAGSMAEIKGTAPHRPVALLH